MAQKKALVSSRAEKEKKPVRVTAFDYDAAHFEEKDIPIGACAAYKHQPTVTWINIDGVHDHEAVKNVCDCYGLDEQTYERIIDTTQRPRIEDHGEYLLIILRMFLYNRETQRLVAEQVGLIVGPGYVLTFQQRDLEEDVFDPVRKRIRTAGTKIRASGSDYLAYRLIDAVVDYYFSIIEIMGEEVDRIEQEAIADPERATLDRMQKIRRDVNYLRKSAWPVREIMNSLQRGESNLVSPPVRGDMRELYEHTAQILDTIETLRDTMSSLLDIYLSSISNRLNEIMKVLTMISTIFIPLTFLVGLYGMNFRYMPEFGWRYGYPLVWGIIVVIVIGMVVYFKKKKWF